MAMATPGRLVTPADDSAARRAATSPGGMIAADGTPEAILAQPADAFVESFVGSDRALKRLALVSARDAMEAAAELPHAHAIAPGASLRDALALMFQADVDALAVADGGGTLLGIVTVAGIRRHALALHGPRH